MKISELKPYSIGIVAENKPLDSKIVSVMPVEDTPFVNGEITSNINQTTVDTVDQSGSNSQVNLTSANTVKAEWLPMGGGNRMSAPDVRRGAEVILYRFADTDKYYWATLKDDMALRKLETVIYGWSGTQDETAKVTADNYYFLEISTHRKVVHFHTSKANGEKFSYDIQINPGEGFIKIQDDAGNFFIFDSTEHQIAMKNVDGSYLDLNKKNFTINVPETVSVNAKNMVMKIEESIVSQATNVSTTASEMIQDNGADIVIQGTTSATVSSPSTTIV